MDDVEVFEQHALRLGKLIGNLQSLECGARMALAGIEGLQVGQRAKAFLQTSEGDWTDVNPLTGPDGLTETLRKYNARVSSECTVDVSRIVRLRDALAHGRVFGAGRYSASRPLKLLKFSKGEKGGRVQVEMAIDMTEEWFKDNTALLLDALRRITKALDYEMLDLRTRQSP